MKHDLAVNEHQVHRELASERKFLSAGKCRFEAERLRAVALAGTTGIFDIAKHFSRVGIPVVSFCTLEQCEEVLRRWMRKIAMQFLQL
jgi:hypothetical protein